MDQFEKVEKLRERANVSYEEAKEALEASNWDLLDAMVYLEKNGKAKAPEQETYSTNYEDQSQYVSVKDKVKEKRESKNDGFFKQMCKLVKLLWKKSKENSFRICRKGEEILVMPVWVLVLALFFAWHVVVPALIVGLFFDCSYSFYGKGDLEQANKAMEKAGEFADKVKDEFDKL